MTKKNLKARIEIKLDDLTSDAIPRLLSEHYQQMLLHSPKESVHALEIEKLRSADLTFWSAWIDNEIAGCGGLKQLDKEHAEIKSMRTSASFLRQGVAAKILAALIDEARNRGYRALYLETGTAKAFMPAQKLYRQFGFEFCGPFADYRLDPHSVFMVKNLAEH